MWAGRFFHSLGPVKGESNGVQTEQEDLGLGKAGGIQPGNIVDLFVILDKPDWPFHEVGTHINNKCLDVYFVRKGYILMFIHVIIHYSYVPAPVTRSQLFITLWLYFSLALVFMGSRVEKAI